MHFFVRSALGLAIGFGLSVSASAADIIDQSNITTVDREFQNFFMLGQSFQPTADSISFAAFQIRATGTATIVAQLFAGGGYSGQLLGTSNAVTIGTAFALTEFRFDPIAFVPNELYTLRLSSSTGTFRARATSDTYARGMYYNQSGGSALNIDLVFAQGYTTAAAAVPEPATWATMLAGFALVGTAIRRRKTVGVAA